MKKIILILPIFLSLFTEAQNVHRYPFGTTGVSNDYVLIGNRVRDSLQPSAYNRSNSDSLALVYFKQLYDSAVALRAAFAASGVTTITNSDGTITISPTSGNAVASLALGHANSWTGQQTFGTSAPIFSTMTAGSALFAGTSGLLSQDNANYFYSSSAHSLLLGTTTADANNANRLLITNGASAATLAEFQGSGSAYAYIISSSKIDIGLNTYYASGFKYGGTGTGVYAGDINFDHNTGTLSYLTTSATGNANAAATLATVFSVDRLGNVTANNLVGVSYTPNLTNTTNISSSSLSQAVYSRVGNTVTVTVSGAFTPTVSSTPTTITIDLPITTATTLQTGVGGGTLALNAGGLGYISTFASVNSATTFQIYSIPTTTLSSNFSITIQYHLN